MSSVQHEIFWMSYIHGKSKDVQFLSRLKSPSESAAEETPFASVQKKKIFLKKKTNPTREVVLLFTLQGATLVWASWFVFLPAESWPGCYGTTGMILVLLRRGNNPHSSWAAATAWSPVWRGCGPGWTGWSCPCTVADAGWFLPAPSGLPLTAILKFICLKKRLQMVQ